MKADGSFENVYEVNTKNIRQRWQNYFDKLNAEGRTGEHIPVLVNQFAMKVLHTLDGRQVSPFAFQDIYPHASLEANTYEGSQGASSYVFNTKTGECMKNGCNVPQSEFQHDDIDPAKIEDRMQDWKVTLILDRDAQTKYRGSSDSCFEALEWRSLAYGLNAKATWKAF